ncbi:hypothetical protein FA09DRAFT_33938 [Tilletiopsis washingtonensis]|uniref:Uncharacterized protein n=1 Tax=Tilletiopsis washingtonensis TaxID=58919 RepID=A0A316Z840_9BASI|nr:hypothetical protein FA09DRAFT_33938 [Tilletiopsis washingtonensis]PWN97957.1 hypothetical protein FA09DRAFT_33938 [Tilletiopsis washingtonensis]
MHPRAESAHWCMLHDPDAAVLLGAARSTLHTAALLLSRAHCCCCVLLPAQGTASGSASAERQQAAIGMRDEGETARVTRPCLRVTASNAAGGEREQQPPLVSLWLAPSRLACPDVPCFRTSGSCHHQGRGAASRRISWSRRETLRASCGGSNAGGSGKASVR